jgi:ribosomal protein S18 acetylase RimI-like enzyme
MQGRKILQDSAVADSAAADAGVCVSREDIALRAATDADMDFLRDVFSSTRMDEFMRGGVPHEKIESLLASQFSIQYSYYRRHYPAGCFDIIMYRGRPVGRLYHDWSGDAAQVIDIALLPAYRGAGIGSYLMRALVFEAARKRMPMRLYVEFDNPVRALYRRLGFVAAGENGVYELMQRDDMPFDDEDVRATLNDLRNSFLSPTFA